LYIFVLILALFAVSSTPEQPQVKPEFDVPINPNIYLIRPGDNFEVTFIRANIPPLNLKVNAEGKIVDATLGEIDLSHTTFSDARNILKGVLKKMYNAGDIVVSVRETQQVSISISGAVENPGIYSGYTSQRVSELINDAGGIKHNGSKRKIIFSGGPKDNFVDLERTLVNSENGYNPPLYAGYHIYVPYKSDSVVQVVGEVNNPKEVELVAGDDLDLLIKLAGGFTGRADTGNIRILSLNGDIVDKINPGNVIYIPAREIPPESSLVTVFGAVVNPGQYRFNEGITLNDLLTRAGGFTSNAGYELTTVFRRVVSDHWDQSSNKVYPISNIVKGNGEIDLFVLKPEDSVLVPVNTGYVKVSGEVLNPGLFPYIKGKNASFYIGIAGGYSSNARQDIILKFNRVSKMSESHSPEIQVHDGDEIVVKIHEEM